MLAYPKLKFSLEKRKEAIKQFIIPLQNTTQQPLLESLSNRVTREKLFNNSWNRTEKRLDRPVSEASVRIPGRRRPDHEFPPAPLHPALSRRRIPGSRLDRRSGLAQGDLRRGRRKPVPVLQLRRRDADPLISGLLGDFPGLGLGAQA